MANNTKDLTRIADALGVPLSDFYESQPFCELDSTLNVVETAVLLKQIHAYFGRSNLEDRRNFVVELQLMISKY
ncbi:hypothetical protein FV226_26070 [Methylobacterium sp. WL12]|uniref:hypothetical protein n=1 Tax=Methylobacterium sp. WL12 TaxID=2603890 RepID=UPI0011C93130|nr:hypothetical protein [Methylobacterium sp. WL12]TXM64765.1 hypothetical protein FV226_26070 [Methylobacterium sp. WL12]TXN13957.1 hypothetical protein FV219_04160 [Methylobacterium sp. WL122]